MLLLTATRFLRGFIASDAGVARRTERFPLGTRYAWLWLLNCILSNPLGWDALGLHPRPMICRFQALDRRFPASPELMALLPSALQRLSALLRSSAFVRCTGLLPAGPSQFQRAPLTTWELSFEIRDVAQVLHRFMNGYWSHAFQLHLVHATLAGLATILRRHDHSTSTQPRHLCALVSRRTVRSGDLSSAFASLLRRGVLLGAPWMFPSVDIAKSRA